MSDAREQFDRLLETHHARIFRYVFSMVRNLDDAQDVFQQTCIALWDDFDKFELGTNFAAWACSVARFRVLRYFRAKRTNELSFCEQVHGSLLEQQSHVSDLEYSELRQQLSACIEELPEHHRTLVDRFYGRRESIHDIADELGRPVRSVYNTIRRIRRSLRTCIVASEGAACQP